MDSVLIAVLALSTLAVGLIAGVIATRRSAVHPPRSDRDLVKLLLDRSEQERKDFRADLEGTSGFFSEQIKHVQERADRSFALHEQSLQQHREQGEQLMGVVLAICGKSDNRGFIEPVSKAPIEPQTMSDLDELNIQRAEAGLPPLASLEETEAEAALQDGGQIPVDLLASTLAGQGLGNGVGVRR